MPKIKRLAAFLVLTVLTGVFVLAGCSQGKSRAASDRLLKAVQEAQRRYDAATALLANPVYQSEGKPLTAGEEPATEKIELLPLLAVNPEAMERLSQAQSELSAAIAENSEAAEETRSLALSVQGRILALEGYCHAAGAQHARDKTSAAIEQAIHTVGLLNAQSELAKFYSAMASLGSEEAQKQLAVAQEDVKKNTQLVAKTEEEIASLQKQREELVAANETLYTKARQLRTDSRLARGEKATQLLNQAMTVEAEINQAASKIAELEYRLDNAAQQKQSEAVELSAATSRAAALESVLKNRSGSSAEMKPQVQAVEAAVEQSRKDADAAMEQVVSILGEANAAQEKAIESYNSASSMLRQAKAAAGTEPSSEIVSLQADVMMQMAALSSAKIRLGVRLVRLVDQAQKITPPPAALEKVKSSLGDMEALRKETSKQYQETAELYEKAMSGCEREVRWAYQGQAAAAYIAAYNLTQDPAVKTQADKLLKEALEDKKDSPYLATVVELQKLLSAGGK